MRCPLVGLSGLKQVGTLCIGAYCSNNLSHEVGMIDGNVKISRPRKLSNFPI